MTTVPRSVVVAVALLGVLAGCTSSPPTPAPVESESASGAPAAAGLRPATAAGPLPGYDATGPARPTEPVTSVSDGSGLVVSTTPTLLAPRDIDADDFRFEVFDISAGQQPGVGDPLTSITAGRAWQVPDDLLADGRQYAWRARSANDESAEWSGPFTIDVDTTRPGLAPRDDLGGVSTHLVTGVPAMTWASRSFPTVASRAYALLEYSPTQAQQEWLPAGWRMTVPLASRWTTFTPSTTVDGEAPRSVYIADTDGRSMTFTLNDYGVYAQTWSNGRRMEAASSGNLQRTGDTWQLTEVNGDITEFRGGHPVTLTRSGLLVGTVDWDQDGRIVRVTDPSDRRIAFAYGSDCPAAAGFVAAPKGVLCGITWWDGTQTQVSYVPSVAGVQIGLISDAVGGGGPMSEIGLGMGWDGAGRLAAVRSPLVNAAVASGVLDGAARDVLTEITYDGQGRVSGVAASAPTPGAERIVHTYEYPTISESDSRTGEGVTAAVVESVMTGDYSPGASTSPVGSELGGGRLYEIVISAADWRPFERRDRDGARTTMGWDPKTQRVTTVTDYEGRTTTYSYEDGRRSGFTGPSSTGEQAYTQSSRVDEDADGSPLRGMAADFWATDDLSGRLAQGGWIARSGEAEQEWTKSPVGSEAWSGRFTGTWTTSTGRAKATPWVLEVVAAKAQARVFIDNRPCEVTSGDKCRLDLRDGEHAVRVDFIAESGAATLGIGAAEVVDDVIPDRIPLMSDVSPGFGLTTSTRTDDYITDDVVMESETQYDAPWTGLPTRIETPGGLVSTAAYEGVGTEGWGRKLSGTTPGGMTTSTDYWPVTGGGEAAPCTDASSAPQAGEVRSITRTDGVVVQRWFDAAGRTSAVRTGTPDQGELACWSYAADGTLVSSRLFAANGDVVEEVTVEIGVDGDPRRTRTNVRTPGVEGLAPTESVSETTVDLLGRIVTYRDLSGVTFDYRYDVQGNQVSRTASIDGRSIVVAEQEYSSATGRPTSMSIDGKTVADISYDSVGRVARVYYASDVKQTYRYRANGTVEILAIELPGGGAVVDSTSTNDAGRVTSRTTEVGDLGRLDTARTWSYDYDSAARLQRALLEVGGDTAGVGAKKHRLEYGFGAQDSTCRGASGDPGADLNRTSGRRDDVEYVTCYDAAARVVTTTDPLLAPRGGTAQLTWDDLGRLTASKADGAELAMTWTWGGLPRTISDGLGVAPIVTEIAHAMGRIVAQRSTGGTTATTRMAYANPTALAPSVLLGADGAPSQVRLLLPGGALWKKTLATGDVVVEHPGVRGDVVARTDGDGRIVPGPGGGALAETLGPFGEPMEPQRASAGTIAPDAPDYGYGFARLEPTVPGGSGMVLSLARPYLPALGAYIAFDPQPGSTSTGYGFAEADPVNYSDPTGAYSWFDFARNVLAVVSITASLMVPGAQWYAVLAISLLTSGAQLGVTALERNAQGLELTTTDLVFEAISVAVDMAVVGAGAAKSAWKAKSAATEAILDSSDELTTSALKSAAAPANETPSLLKSVAQATLTVAGFQVVLGGGGSGQQEGPASGAEGAGGTDAQDCPVEGGCEGLPSREGQHRVPDRL